MARKLNISKYNKLFIEQEKQKNMDIVNILVDAVVA